MLVSIINILVDGQQQLEYVYAPQWCRVYIRPPQATTENEIDWYQATFNTEYYLFSKNLLGQDQVYHIVPPIGNSGSYFYPLVQDAYISMIYEMDPYSPIWMMAYYPSKIVYIITKLII